MGSRLSTEQMEEKKKDMIGANNLAFDYMAQGQWNDAEGPALQAMRTFKEVFGSKDPLTLITMQQVVHVYKGQGRLRDAENLQRIVIKTRRKVLGREDPATLESETTLASIFRAQGRLQEAEELGWWLVEVKRRVLGVSHPSYFKSASNLAVVLTEQKRWIESEQLGLQVLQSGVEVLGEDHHITLNLKVSTAAALVGQERWQEAEELLIPVVETKKQTKPEHPDTLETMGSLAMCYFRQGRLKEAEEVQVLSYMTCLKVFGLNYLVTKESIENLILIYSGQERWKEAADLKEQLGKVALLADQ